MVENTDTSSFSSDFTAKIAILTAQVQENTNKFLALEDENTTLRRENYNLSERLSAMETTPCPELRFQVPVTHMQSLETLELGKSSTQPSSGSPVIQGFNLLLTLEGQPLITSSAVDTALLHAMSARLNTLNAMHHQIPQSTILPALGSTVGNDVQAPAYTTMPLVTNLIYQSARPNPTMNQLYK